MKIATYTLAQLTAPGNSSSVGLGNTMPANAVFDITIASINTDCTVEVQASDDNFSTIVHGISKTITANGVYALSVPINHNAVRLSFVSETGGTAATIDAKLITIE